MCGSEQQGCVHINVPNMFCIEGAPGSAKLRRGRADFTAVATVPYLDNILADCSLPDHYTNSAPRTMQAINNSVGHEAGK